MLQTLHPKNSRAQTLVAPPPSVQAGEPPSSHTEATPGEPRGCLTLGGSERRSFCRASKGCSGLSSSAGPPGKGSGACGSCPPAGTKLSLADRRVHLLTPGAAGPVLPHLLGPRLDPTRTHII